MSASSSNRSRPLLNFARLYQEGITGFDRMMEILTCGRTFKIAADAVERRGARRISI